MNVQAKVEAPTVARLREPFPPHHISKLPKETGAQAKQRKADQDNGKWPPKCGECGNYHHPKAVHLDYVGHAALTDRLLDTDLEWSWEPLAYTEDGLPAYDKNGGLWIKLTVLGVTRLGYGSAEGKSGGDAVKEIIGDALRNAAMRFGAALDLWHKGELHVESSADEGNYTVISKPVASTTEKSIEKPKWPEGPCTGISNLKAEIRKMKDLGNKASSLEAFEQVAKEFEAHRKQLEDLGHEWWTGIGSDGNTYESVPAWLDRRRAELSEPDHLQILLDAMRENHTKQALTMWAANQEIMIDGLPDDKRRQFEAEYDAYEAGLEQVATVAAG